MRVGPDVFGQVGYFLLNSLGREIPQAQIFYDLENVGGLVETDPRV